ncbi:MAG: FprA family A-type flavoprotein [Pirellulales bacterium]|nr:FprA family A-type flavoprotein [Pirellulales bacterium]
MNTTLCENIDWVGYVDWNVRDFHSYDTEHGATYNAYLIRDEKIALIDAVKAPYGENLLRNVSALCDPAKVDYVVCNHAEPDHSGAMPDVLRAMPNAALVCDKKCAEALAEHYDAAHWKRRIVSTGDAVSLGKRSLQFVETPMVHWPESMFTYVPEEKLLFSMDAFGQHLATSERFDDETALCTVMEEAKAYYANIIMPFGKSVRACLERIAGLEVEMIAPSHGVIWRSHPAKILAAYRNWMEHRPRPKVLVIYDSMWESTGAMAEALRDGAAVAGVQAKLISIRRSNLTRIATDVLDAAAIAFGSATLNHGMMPMAAATLSYLEGLRPRGKAALAFGSYGWGRGGAEGVDKQLRAIGWDILREPIVSKYRPTPAILDECRQAGRTLAEKARVLAAGRAAAAQVCLDP